MTVYPHALREAVDSGFLTLPPKQEPPIEESTPPQSHSEPAPTSYATDISSPTQEAPTVSAVPEPAEKSGESQTNLTIQSQESEEATDGRAEKNKLYAGDATGHSLTEAQVAALPDEAFLQLALLTTRALRRGLPTSGDLKDMITEATGFEEDRREAVTTKLLRQKLAVHSKKDGYRLKPTEKGEQYLEQQITIVKS